MKRRTKKTSQDEQNLLSQFDGETSIISSDVMANINNDDQFNTGNDIMSQSVSAKDSLNQYIQNCRDYDVNIDPNIVIALKTDWDLLQPSKTFSEGGLLPVYDILKKSRTIKKINLGNGIKNNPKYGNANSNARLLKTILQENDVIEELDLRATGLTDDGITELSEGIKINKSLKKLNLSYNNFGEVGADMLCYAVSQNTSIDHLDVSSNALGFQSISRILRSCKCRCKPMSTVLTNGNYVFEEILNSVSHGVCFLFSIMGAFLLITEAANESAYSAYHFWSCVLYSFSLMFLFLSSCLFHSFFMIPQASHILQILDHVGISMLIAGSYTPFLLIGSHHSMAARFLATGEWIVFALHIGIATISDLNAPSTTNVELIIFLFMGVCPVFFWNIITADLEYGAIILYILGGAAYIGGIPFFILGEYHPKYHVIWHLFVALGSCFHWFLVYFFIMNTDISLKETLGETVADTLSNVIKYNFHNFTGNHSGL